MKMLLTASAAVAALFAAAPALAGSGQVDASYTDVESGALTSWNFGGAGVANAGGDWNVQGEAVVHRIDLGGSAGNYTDAGLHLFNRNDSWAAGVYVDTSDVYMISAWGLGVEGQKYFDQVSVGGSIGWTTAEGGFFFGPDRVDGWNATGSATFFATDNFSLGAQFGYIEIEDADATVWGLDAEFKPDSMPVSVFAGYQSQTESDFVGDDISAWTLGLRWNFGGGSLKERDRSGASMKGGVNFSDIVF